MKKTRKKQVTQNNKVKKAERKQRYLKALFTKKFTESGYNTPTLELMVECVARVNEVHPPILFKREKMPTIKVGSTVAYMSGHHRGHKVWEGYTVRDNNVEGEFLQLEKESPIGVQIINVSYNDHKRFSGDVATIDLNKFYKNA